MGKSLTFGLLSTTSIKGRCRDNVANDCFCSWVFGFLVGLGSFLLFFSSCSISLFCRMVSVEVGFLSSTRCPLELAYLFLLPASRVRFQCGHNTPLDLWPLEKFHLMTLGFRHCRQKLQEILSSESLFGIRSVAPTSPARSLYACAYLCSFWPLMFDMFLRKVGNSVSVLESCFCKDQSVFIFLIVIFSPLAF